MSLRSSRIYGYHYTVLCMKTTVELPDALLREAKRVALRDKTTVRAVIERGLRAVVGARASADRFALRRAAFKGDGLVAERSLDDWERFVT